MPEAAKSTEHLLRQGGDPGPGTVQSEPHRPAVRVPKPAKRMTSQVTGDETRARIIAAASETLRVDGIVGMSARTVARRGGFNQALIFYHFGSVDGLIAATAATEGARRAGLYSERFAQVRSLKELVAIAREVHQEEQTQGSVNVLTQMLAGSSASPELRQAIIDGMKPWMELVEQAVRRVVGPSPLASLLPMADAAFAISSLFLGFELMTGADPSGARAAGLLDGIERIAGIIETVLGTGVPAEHDGLPSPSNWFAAALGQAGTQE